MLGNRLKTLREERNLSQDQLAKDLKIGRASISNYELGIRTPDADVLAKYAEYFKCSIDYIMGNTDFQQPPSLKNYLDNTKLDPIVLSKLTGINLGTITGIQNGDIDPDPSDNYYYLENLFQGMTELLISSDQELLSLYINILASKNEKAKKLLKEYMLTLEALLNESCHLDNYEVNEME